MLLKRILVAVALLPIGLFIIVQGGVLYTAFIALVLALAAWEFVRLFRAGGYQPASVLVIAAVVAFTIERSLDGFTSAPLIISLFILASMSYHLYCYERGREQAATDFGITLAGAFYIGWLGAYLVSLRELPDGMWWVLTVLPAVWIADSGAYFIGRTWGRHKMTPRLSPKKSWEGYIAGIASGALGGALLAYAWGWLGGDAIAVTPLRGAILGFTLGVLTILGDLGESMIKRQVGVKDSSNLLPGHGGVFDRIDSWLWAGVIGYYLVLWLF